MEQHELKVRPGQIWEDNDSRIGHGGLRRRRLRILAVLRKNNVSHWYAEVENVETGKTTTIRADRFRPTPSGYRLVSEAPAK